MPADDLYWSPTVLECEESNNFSKSYIDPWDLENYAYIQQQLDSLELSLDRSSPGAQLESSSTFSYIEMNGRKGPIQKYDSVMNSERGTSNYASIDEVTRMNEEITKHRRQSDVVYRNRRYDGDEDDGFDENPYEMQDSSLMYMYETGARLRKVAMPAHRNSRARSDSYTYGDYGYESECPHQLYCGLDDVSSGADLRSPIYDDIKTSPTPNNFGLSKYGHLKIDYSYSWNNLNKYICN